MLRVITSFLGTAFSWVTTGVVMIALAAGAIFWMYGRELPNHEQLAQYAPQTISRIYSGEGRMIDEFARERRLFVPIDDVPETLKQAFISAEDKNFYTHKGFDARSMAAAAFDALKGERLRGASTIPQQVVKNFLLSSDRSAERKIKELILSVRLENTLSKEKILELYLNEIYLGQNSYGVAAAAQTYFNKTLSELSPAEAAYLGALPKKPADLHPVRHMSDAVARRNFVLKEMHENGFLSDSEYAGARAEPLRTVQNGDYEPFRKVLPPRDYFTDEIRRQLSRNFGEEEFFSGGLSVRATVDPELQLAGAQALRAGLENYDRSIGSWRGTGLTVPADLLSDEAAWRKALADTKVARDIDQNGKWHPAVVLGIGNRNLNLGIEGWEEGYPKPVVPRRDIRWMEGSFFDNFELGDIVHVRLTLKSEDDGPARWTLRQVPEVQGGFMAMDARTGRIHALQGGFSYQHSVFNRATQATRQPGSSFKPFVYAAALDSRFSPATILIDAPIEIDTGTEIWRPTNSTDKFYGPTPLRTGIEYSRNLMTVRLTQEVGMETIADYAERFGVYDYLQPYLANALGSQETTLFKMVAAYAMFANGGERVEPTLVDRVQNRWGETVYRHDNRVCVDCRSESLELGAAPRIAADRERVIDAVTAYQLTSMMEGVVQRGSAAYWVNLDVPIAGKTGTTNDAKDAWFIGFTSNIVAGCYIGYDRPRSLGEEATGGGLCGPVFNQFMEKATAKYGGGRFRVPPGGHFIKIDRYTGARLPDTAEGPNVVAEYFRNGEEPVFGAMLDGGFAMGGNLQIVDRSEDADTDVETAAPAATAPAAASGNADFGALSSGGLY